ncbi:MAG: hypothetical protein JWO05_1825 [Gemmatimonadetes bacterium]|nr:hypothetical protein [Gemmatimonadota bacterium]
MIRPLARAAALLVVLSSLGAAQATAPISFDALKTTSASDSLRRIVARQRADAERLQRAASALRDSLAVARARTISAPAVRPETVLVTQMRVDTVKVAVPAAPAVVAAPAVAAKPVAIPEVVKPQAKPATITPAPAVAPLLPTVSAMLQLWAIGGDAGYRNSYRVRRAEIKVVGDLGRKAKAIVMLDVAKALSLNTGAAPVQPSVAQSSRVLQDALISVPFGTLQLDAGQQKLFLGLEGMTSSGSLETVERALMFSDRARGGSFGDVRDVGVALRGKWTLAEFQVGAFDGSGEAQNDVDKNVGKSLVARVAVRPSFVKGLQVGASGASAGAGSLDNPVRDRAGAELRFSTGRVLLVAEAMHGQDDITTRFGAYALASVGIAPTVKLQARLDSWDPDTHREAAAADVTQRDALVGASWLPAGTRLKLQLAAVHKTFTRNITKSRSQVLLNMQAAW